MIKLKAILNERTLYHGTTVDNAKQIEKYGLVPQRGDFVSNAYGGEYDSEEDFENEVPELTFAADKKTLDHAVTAATHHIANKLGKNFHDVTDQEFIRHAAIIKMYDESDFTHRPEDDDNYRGEHPTSVEPGDYYSESGAVADEILTGNSMIRLLKKYGLWPRVYGDVTSKKTIGQMRDFLMKYVLNKTKQVDDPNQPNLKLKHSKGIPPKLLNQIRMMSDKDVENMYHKIRREITPITE
jgi:hypothetical protein